MTFSLKRKTNRWQEIQKKLLDQSYESREKPFTNSKRGRITESLMAVGRTDVYKKITNCLFSKPDKGGPLRDYCGNVYCDGCRNRLANIHYNRVRSKINCGRWIVEDLLTYTPLQYQEIQQRLTHSQYTNSDLLHITGVCGISKVTYEDVQQVIKKDTKKWIQIRKEVKKLTKEPYWIECVYEYELVNWQFLSTDTREEGKYKRQQIKQLLDNHNERFFTEPFVFVHWHGITNIPKDKLPTIFKKLYYQGNDRLTKTNPDTGIFIQSFHSDKTLDENIRKLTSYPFKQPFRYKHTFRGNDYTSGEHFTEEELGRLISLYDIVPGRAARSLFRSVSNEHQIWWNVKSQIEDEIQKQGIRYRKWKSKRGALLPFIMRLHQILHKIEKSNINGINKKVTQIISEMISHTSISDSSSHRSLSSLKRDFNQMIKRQPFQSEFIPPFYIRKKVRKSKSYWTQQQRYEDKRIQSNSKSVEDSHYTPPIDLTDFM